ncbi:DUF507 family protein [Campylobacter sp. LH-2024]|uniref:DUF507 family protein n=1 Tax=Campylobacter molothri TaxID=1032242 RepID=A0ACC5VZB4_9BACT|nr:MULTISPECIES: DUF507 family protein [unclassified Campylobacter]MBZ7928592.1 DUF507 family protein [Campylobacter sp. RM10542]MBZ7929575.1 DUF507 family protein [Campylobacter sp. W0067]MBZ7931915.1 DUF507 family protein [Campylobacter sp. RM12910]MBZ7932417.1 DUF507 family protein [Campylobacter sp. RM10543]MBZ7934897.1 DUF507 family protein [Campylobacter sp. W0065]MBZ7936749.1 DUF507 family protein [Campylobacter sp. RM10538]MBZ7941159.1 DUF507 family protein [Campylobacter sp. W0047]
MRIKLPHIPYITNKIVLDLANSSFVEIKSSMEELNPCVAKILENDVLNERRLDERTKELLEEQEDEMELMQVDRKNMFWLVKKKLAPKFDVILNLEDRHNRLSHRILEELIEHDYINFIVSENRVKNLIFSSIDNYLKIYENLEDEVYEKISNYKTKPIPGSEEYELIFEKLYQEELRKKGMF